MESDVRKEIRRVDSNGEEGESSLPGFFEPVQANKNVISTVINNAADKLFVFILIIFKVHRNFIF